LFDWFSKLHAALLEFPHRSCELIDAMARCRIPGYFIFGGAR